MSTASRDSKPLGNVLSIVSIGALLAGCASFWLAKVNSIVPDPYLDEEFHVRQAQVYCKGDFHIWDPKITTPPGLYLVSWLIYCITGRCDIIDLRALNVVTVLLGYFLTYGIVRQQSPSSSRTIWSLTAANVWLFPPLFFFSGLYYTDVQSAFWTLLAYRSYLKHEQRNFSSWSDAFLQVILGAIALFFRQSNIFWVAVFPAGLALISSATRLSTRTPGAFGGATTRDPVKIIGDSWSKLRFYDLPVYDANIEDYVLMAMSLAVVTIANLKRSLGILLPYFTLILFFVAFIIWNGGVVLGDKSNHIATIHLPQMLYLQPYILFFSFPILIHSLISRQISLPTSITQISRAIFVLGTATNLAMLAVHYNTIVHPFTLADNRHYVFYVFRVLLRREEIRYLAAPVYVAVGYLVLQVLGARPVERVVGGKKGKAVIQPMARGCSSSFVLVWVLTTALSLVTAPLVEPRYCIFPWIMWRLQVPTDLTQKAFDEKAGTRSEDGKKSGWNTGIVALLAESVWFVVIAAGTGYMFLYRGFSWPQEPGKTQRFMW